MLTINNVPALNDNYIWLLSNEDQQCVIVDPSAAEPVLDAITEKALTPVAILITHHHHDHTDGIDGIVKKFPDIIIYGPQSALIPQISFPLKDKQKFTLLSHEFLVLSIPGHTLDHIGFYCEGMLFCGDTLFSGGCGRLFEGTPEQMFHSLSTLCNLPDETLIYCAHEYTQANLNFAQVVEPNNAKLKEYAQQVTTLRENNEPTLPTTLEREKAINPFLRAHIPAVKSAVSVFAQGNSDIETFAALRKWKDNF